MELNEREEKINEARQLFLMGGYGQMVVLKSVFTCEELRTTEPGLLIKQVYCRLGLKKGDFKEDSFRRWLKRYRQRELKPRLSVAMYFEKELINQNETPVPFQFTDPSSLPGLDEPLLKFIK